MSRFIIISNRLPFSVENQGNKINVRQSSGGLVSALKSYFERENYNDQYTERIWVGSMDASEEDWQLAKQSAPIPDGFQIEPLFPESNSYNNFYNGFSNSTLWPLFHYFSSLVEFKK